MPTKTTTKTLPPEEAAVATTPTTLDREQCALLIATVEKLGKCILAAAIIGPHKTGEGVKREIERFWEAF